MSTKFFFAPLYYLVFLQPPLAAPTGLTMQCRTFATSHWSSVYMEPFDSLCWPHQPLIATARKATHWIFSHLFLGSSKKINFWTLLNFLALVIFFIFIDYEPRGFQPDFCRSSFGVLTHVRCSSLHILHHLFYFSFFSPLGWCSSETWLTSPAPSISNRKWVT